ncbi:MAG TPA: hypothetical protein VFC67_01805, partial [Prolixibacteraceae bacterium]|nr:hypothetical protein [Prolixibacteraceae bacterium]
MFLAFFFFFFFSFYPGFFLRNGFWRGSGIPDLYKFAPIERRLFNLLYLFAACTRLFYLCAFYLGKTEKIV